MLSKKEFVEVINELKISSKLVDDVNKIFRESSLNTDFQNASGMAIYHDGLVVRLLSKMFDDIGEYISWWVFEQNFGENKLAVYIDDKERFLENAEELYDFIMENVEDRKK